MRPADYPIGFTNGRDDMGALVIRQRFTSLRLSDRKHSNRRGLAACQELGRLPAQNRTYGHNDAALDYILQFPDITWPGMAFQALHYLGRNCLYDLTLLSGKLLHEVSRE